MDIYDCICIACNKSGVSTQVSCECGHNLQDAIMMTKAKRRPSERPEQIKHSGKSILNSFKNNKDSLRHYDNSNNNGNDSYTVKKRRTLCLTLTKKKKTSKYKHKKNYIAKVNEETESQPSERTHDKIKQLEPIYHNSYFYQCKSYKPIKDVNDNFQFDFASFNSDDPYYPNALDDINSKIFNNNSFWKSL